MVKVVVVREVVVVILVAVVKRWKWGGGSRETAFQSRL